MELHLANVVLGNQFSQEQVDCLFDLGANHVFVRDGDLYLADGLDLGLGEGAAGWVSENFKLVLLV